MVFLIIVLSQPVEKGNYCLSLQHFFSARDEQFSFLAPLAEGQRAIVMALCLSCGRLSIRVCVRKLFLQNTSPQKLLTGFLRNFTGMFLGWSSFEFLQIIVFYEEFWLPWQSK